LQLSFDGGNVPGTIFGEFRSSSKDGRRRHPGLDTDKRLFLHAGLVPAPANGRLLPKKEVSNIRLSRSTVPVVTVTDDDREQINKIFRLLELAEQWREWAWPQVQPGSAMRKDDAKTDPHQVSHLIHQSTNAAIDHLHCLRNSMRGNGPDSLWVHVQAPFSLLRGAIENTSTAMWLMAPANRQERIRRRLRYEWGSINNAEAFVNAARFAERDRIQKRKARVLKLATAAGIDERELRQKPGFSEIVSDVGVAVDLVDDERNLPLLFWKLCSAISHGDTWVLNTFDLEHLETLEPGVGGYNMTAPVPLLWAGAQATMTMISLVHQKYAMQIMVHR
jgi:hypothetical protein